MESDIIIGIHSIIEALANPSRINSKIFCTDKGKSLLLEALKSNKSISSYEIVIMDLQNLNKNFDKKIKDQGWAATATTIPSQIFLETSTLKIYDSSMLLKELNEMRKLKKIAKLFALDNVSDVHNGAAILRTAAFFGVDALIMSLKGTFGLTPSFYRIASGSTEYVKLVKSVNLSRFLSELQNEKIECIGFSERADCDEISNHDFNFMHNDYLGRCLVLGSEDKGLSNAVERVLRKKVSFASKGKIETLNVSVAAALAMEKYF
ncbi:MAG: hypothetical protein HQK51_18855 [Oligoflexia bacterium]|nr:hypothetical protein [Oligoflexia bacterium]